jgi:hypothetical protein
MSDARINRVARLAIVSAVLLLVSIPVMAQHVPLAIAEQAIALGREGASFDLIIRYEDFVLTIRGPVARIARAAREARVAFRPFTIADVTDDMASDLVTFTAVPAAPSITGRGVSMAPRATGILLSARGRRNAAAPIKPLRSDPLAIEWSARGRTYSGQGFVAYFARDMFPSGQFDVLVTVDSATEPRRATVTLRDLFRIR